MFKFLAKSHVVEGKLGGSVALISDFPDAASREDPCSALCGSSRLTVSTSQAVTVFGCSSE